MQFLARGVSRLRAALFGGAGQVSGAASGTGTGGMRILRSHAAEWLIDTDKIFVSGASAGAHLAGMLGVFWNQGWLADMLETTGDVLKPAGLLLSYPVITSREGKGHLPSFRNLLGEEFKAKRGELSLEHR